MRPNSSSASLFFTSHPANNASAHASFPWRINSCPAFQYRDAAASFTSLKSCSDILLSGSRASTGMGMGYGLLKGGSWFAQRFALYEKPVGITRKGVTAKLDLETVQWLERERVAHWPFLSLSGLINLYLGWMRNEHEAGRLELSPASLQGNLCFLGKPTSGPGLDDGEALLPVSLTRRGEPALNPPSPTKTPPQQMGGDVSLAPVGPKSSVRRESGAKDSARSDSSSMGAGVETKAVRHPTPTRLGDRAAPNPSPAAPKPAEPRAAARLGSPRKRSA